MVTTDEVRKFLEGNPVVVALGLVAVGLTTLTAESPARRRPDVPGLGGRRNSAWRGKGSFGSAPFGSQVSHRR